MRINFALRLFTAFFAILPAMASAHEFWIDPDQPSYAPGAEIVADVRVGEMMIGSSQVFNADRFRQVGVVSGGKPQRLEGRLGDRPALRFETPSAGLNIFAIETVATDLTYANFEKFERFAQAHGEDFAIAAHREADLPERAFKEAYFRFAKALVKVGDGAGADQSVGFAFELVALSNPYGNEPLRFALYRDKTLVPDHQVDVFSRAVGASDKATQVIMRTDENGEITIPRVPGEYLVNAVKLERPNARLQEALDVVWVSLWASSTFVLE